MACVVSGCEEARLWFSAALVFLKVRIGLAVCGECRGARGLGPLVSFEFCWHLSVAPPGRDLAPPQAWPITELALRLLQRLTELGSTVSHRLTEPSSTFFTTTYRAELYGITPPYRARLYVFYNALMLMEFLSFLPFFLQNVWAFYQCFSYALDQAQTCGPWTTFQKRQSRHKRD